MQHARPIILASASPRRQELMKQITAAFEIDVADIDETPIPGETPWQTAERLADQKAQTIAARHGDAIIIAGDTVVAIEKACGYEQLAKPTDPAHACDMLRALSDRKHLVITGVCIARPAGKEVFSVTTTVEFRALTDKEISAYVATGEPMDKAGAYAIQGGAKGFVKGCEGSLTNVIGFPLEEIKCRLQLPIA